VEESNGIKIIEHDLKKDSILDIIRARPAMYIGSSSLTELRFFLGGFHWAEHLHGIEASPLLPRDFADWVGYRLHLDSNWSGFWHRAILSRVRDEHLALVRFYELRDEYLRRQPKLIATIRKDCREHRMGRHAPTGEIVWNIESYPESLRIVTYTDDPGFFLVADESESFSFNGWFCPALDGMVIRLMSPEEKFEVHDQSTWDRLLAENKKYKRNRARRMARTQRKVRESRDAGKPIPSKGMDPRIGEGKWRVAQVSLLRPGILWSKVVYR
jgi:hypothetical protein